MIETPEIAFVLKYIKNGETVSPLIIPFSMMKSKITLIDHNDSINGELALKNCISGAKIIEWIEKELSLNRTESKEIADMMFSK